MRNIISTLLLTSALVPGVAFACEGKDKAIQTVNVVEGGKLAKAKLATFVDVNGDDTRTKDGIIPGAVLLTSTEFGATELPAAKDAKLVFYCANTQCGASKMAAKRALGQGYADVWVLPEGIKGWKAAGNATATYTKPANDKQS